MADVLKLATPTWVSVRLLVTGSYEGAVGVTVPTIAVLKTGAAIATFSGTSANWRELDPTHLPGVYEVLLDATATNTLGSLQLSVRGTGTDHFVGLYTVCAHTLDETYRLLDVVRIHVRNGNYVDTMTNQFVVVDDNDVVYEKYDLFDENGQPSSQAIFQRHPQKRWVAP